MTEKKWTLMFFFASDNILSPSMLTQIKAIKAAGYQQDTNVLLHFDPNEKGVPTRVFEINRTYSQANSVSKIGGGDAPLVSVLASDDITPVAIKGLDAKEIDQMDAEQALTNFLNICATQYPATNYMLFLVGHGMVVGGDAFLPDDNPISAIGLAALGEILKTFSDQIKTHNGVLQLLGMHSCSMSGVEVAYQLQNTARYMMASQGISFIGAWPYRQLLITIYNAVEEARVQNSKVDVFQLVQRMHDLCIQHSADFMVGGYSADLCLCTLNANNVGNLDGPIQSLGQALKEGLTDARCRDLILLAHLKSQSYWQETYTDLYDFCLCLRRLSSKHDPKRPPILKDLSSGRQPRDYDLKQKAIDDACESVMKLLKPGQAAEDDGPVIRTDFIGAGSQYSHGLSIYFPWSEPLEDRYQRALTNYKNYAFSSFATSAWLKFLEAYFKETRRPNRLREDIDFNDQDVSYQNDPGFMQALAAARNAFKVPGTQSGSDSATALDQKINPPDAGGGSCACPSIKNYSKDFLMSPGASAVFVRAA